MFASNNMLKKLISYISDSSLYTEIIEPMQTRTKVNILYLGFFSLYFVHNQIPELCLVNILYLGFFSLYGLQEKQSTVFRRLISYISDSSLYTVMYWTLQLKECELISYISDSSFYTIQLNVMQKTS